MAIEEVFDPEDKNPPYLADEHIPDRLVTVTFSQIISIQQSILHFSVIDKIFNNNTGENVEEFRPRKDASDVNDLFSPSTSFNLRNVFSGGCKEKAVKKDEPSKSLTENEKTNKEILNSENVSRGSWLARRSALLLTILTLVSALMLQIIACLNLML
jgi:hypothetical protein